MMYTFNVNLNNKTFMNSPIEMLELKTSHRNIAKRHGITTVGDLVNAISSSEDMHSWRGISNEGCEEIMKKVLYFYIECLPKKRVKNYIEETMANNPGFTNYKALTA